MRIRFTLGAARQVEDRYVCYLLGVLVGEIGEALAAAWHFAARRNREMMVVWLLKGMVASDDARKYSTLKAPAVSGLAIRIHGTLEPLHREYDLKKGDLDDRQIEEARRVFRSAGRIFEDLSQETAEACGAG